MAPRVRFHPSVAPPSELNPFPVRRLAALLAEQGMPDGTVHCILTDDAELGRLNARFRGKRGPTDVLTFPYEEAPGGDVRGEIYVSLERAAAQAAERDEPVGREVWRLFVHGALHLTGHDHGTSATDRAMRAVQERWVDRVLPAR